MKSRLSGDNNVLVTAYPTAKRQLLQKYIPDSIIGTLYKGGVNALRKNASSYDEMGEFNKKLDTFCKHSI